MALRVRQQVRARPPHLRRRPQDVRVIAIARSRARCRAITRLSARAMRTPSPCIPRDKPHPIRRLDDQVHVIPHDRVMHEPKSAFQGAARTSPAASRRSSAASADSTPPCSIRHVTCTGKRSRQHRPRHMPTPGRARRRPSRPPRALPLAAPHPKDEAAAASS